MEDVGSKSSRKQKFAKQDPASDWSDSHQDHARCDIHLGKGFGRCSCRYHLSGVYQPALPLGQGLGNHPIHRRCSSHSSIAGAMLIAHKISSLSAFTVASMCESLYPTLAKRVDNYHPTAKGVMTSHVGRHTLISLWVMSVLSLFASVLWIIDAARSKKRAVAGSGTIQGGAPMYLVPKIVRRATGGLLGGNRRYDDTSYDTLRVASREPSRGPSRKGSEEELTEKIVHRRAHSREPSEGPPRGTSEDTMSTVLHDSEELLGEKRALQSRYEPFRHRDLP